MIALIASAMILKSFLVMLMVPPYGVLTLVMSKEPTRRGIQQHGAMITGEILGATVPIIFAKVNCMPLKSFVMTSTGLRDQDVVLL